MPQGAHPCATAAWGPWLLSGGKENGSKNPQAWGMSPWKQALAGKWKQCAPDSWTGHTSRCLEGWESQRFWRHVLFFHILAFLLSGRILQLRGVFNVMTFFCISWKVTNEFTVLLIVDDAWDLKKHGKASSVQQIFNKDLLHSRQGAGNAVMGRNWPVSGLYSLEDCQCSLLSDHSWPPKQDVFHWLWTIWTLLQLRI